MGCSSSKATPVDDNDDQDIDKLQQTLLLTYETDSDNEKVLLIGNDTSNDNYISFFKGVHIKFELYYNN